MFSLLRRRGRGPVSPIASLGQIGRLVRTVVEGELVGRAEHVAPISGRPAIGYRLLIERESGVRGWEPVHEDVGFGEFELRDASGSIRVRPCSGALELGVGEYGGEGGPFRPLPDVVERLVAARMAVHGVLFHVGVRWREWVLEPGALVWIRGSVVSEPCEHETVGYRQLGRKLVLTGCAAAPLEIYE